MTKRINMVGKRFNRWTVLSFAFSKKSKHLTNPMWKCRCDCGTIKVISGATLRNGTSKSCGCYKQEKARLAKGEASFNRLYNSYKIKAKERGYTFCLSRNDFKKLTKQNCYYCGAKPNQKNRIPQYYGDYIYNGVDRINNDKGYELDNVVSCCGMCNRMKNKYSYNEFLEHIQKISSYYKIKQNADPDAAE